ncbi:MAG: DUF6884 domain-containing protein [Candidatus Heimdallarchaeaceae archaeon]
MEVHSSFRILIVNSCGKAKAVVHPHQPTCQELETKEQREKAKKDFSSMLKPAKELYIGPQAKAVKQAVDILREFCEVDYFIISAGFGLVEENEKLPPYNCSFSNQSKKKILEMSKRLEIEESLVNLLKKKYDFVYLSLGQDYLKALGNLSNIQSLGTEIIHFGRNLPFLPSNFYAFDETEFVGTQNQKTIFDHPIGALIAAKGNILLNYALFLKKNNLHPKKLSFRSWWEERKNLIVFEEENVPISSEEDSQRKFTNFKYKIRHYNRGEDYLVGEDSIAQKIKETLTNNDMKLIADSCNGLKTINTKKGESRKDFVAKYKKYYPIYRKLINIIEPTVTELKERNGETKTKLIGEFVQQIREKQEKLGLSTYLLNEVKYTIMKTVIKWIDNPKELEKKSVYVPRSKERKSKGKTARLIVNRPEIEIELKEPVKQKNRWEIEGFLINKSNYPLQNIKIKVKDSKDKQIKVIEVTGNLVEKAAGEIHINFVAAPMGEETEKLLKIKFVVNELEDITDGFSLEIEQDFTFTKERIMEIFEFD